MVERFFFVKQVDVQCNENDHVMLLSGPPSSGKTSLLFQFAFNSAVRSNTGNRNVVFICNQGRLETKPPYLSQGIDHTSNVFQRIEMKYVDDDEGIKKYFAAFHMYETFPAAVVIDDFGDFFDERNCQDRYGNSRGRDLAMVRILALCSNAVIHANKTQSCKLLLCDTHKGDSPRLLFIYKRWISSIFTIKGDGSGSFYLKNETFSSCSSEKQTARDYIPSKVMVVSQELTMSRVSPFVS